MKKEPITELGENLEYLRTIVNNKIELVKLDFVEASSKIFAYSILLLVVGSFVTLILGLLSGLMVLAFAHLVDSLIVGIACTIVCWMLCILLAFIFRKRLFYTPLEKIIWTKFSDNDNR